MICLGDFEYNPADVLGNGAFAIVYKGRFKNDPSIKVAIKLMLKDQNIIKAKSLLSKEISVLKDLNHDHIVRLYSHNISTNGVYLVMEYCNCGDLSEYLQIKKTLPESTIRHFLFQIGSAMDAMNNKKIMHRDLKPGNILLSYHGDLKHVSEIPGNKIIFKLADFGFARFLQNGMMAVTMCGSPMYMAPEVLMSKKYDALADIWSMGVIVYQCLTGKAAFYANTPEALKRIYETNFNLRPKIPDSCSPELADLLILMLKRDPIRRINFQNFLRHPFIQKVPINKKAKVPRPISGNAQVNLANKQKVVLNCPIGSTKVLPGIPSDNFKPIDNLPKEPLKHQIEPRKTRDTTPSQNITLSHLLEYDYTPTLDFNYTLDNSQDLSEEPKTRDEMESDGYMYDEEEINDDYSKGKNVNYRSPLTQQNQTQNKDDFVIVDKNEATRFRSPVSEEQKYPFSHRENHVTKQNPVRYQTKQYLEKSPLPQANANLRANDVNKLETIIGSPNQIKNSNLTDKNLKTDHEQGKPVNQQAIIEQQQPKQTNYVHSDHLLGLGMHKHHLLDGEFSLKDDDIHHSEELNKIVMVLELCELLSELAERKAAALVTDYSTTNNNQKDDLQSSNSSTRANYPSEAQRIVEQIVLYRRILYYLEYVFVQVKKAIISEHLKTTDSSVKRICECNSLYHRSYIRLRQLAKQIQRQDLADSLGYQLACITANKLIYQHTFDQCLAAEMDEYIGEIRLCLQRYNAAIILLHGLTQHAKSSGDKLFLNNCMKIIRDRSTSIWTLHSNQELSRQNLVFNEFLPGLGDVPPLCSTKNTQLQTP